jgi:M penetrans paralogue family 26
MNDQQNLLTPNNSYNQQSNLSNATASLVLGIISIVTSLCYVSALIGIICGIIGLVLGNKDRSAYQATPELYTSTSYSQSNAGRTCSIIGLILSALWLVFLIIMLIFVGSMSYNDWR